MSQSAVAVLADVAEKVKGSNTLVRERVVNALVEKEVASRAELLSQSIAKLVELDKALKKMKPDIETVDGEGKASATWSKKAWDEKKKATERKDNFERALCNVLDDTEGSNEKWAKLREALQKAGNAGGGDKSE